MRYEQHISKNRFQWHVHLYMTPEEYEKQSKVCIQCIADLDDIVDLPNDIKSDLFGLFYKGLCYVIIKKENSK